jgi:anti-sigma-K factor RskA
MAMALALAMAMALALALAMANHKNANPLVVRAGSHKTPKYLKPFRGFLNEAH